MKTRIYLLVLILLAILYSCSDDNIDEVVSRKSQDLPAEVISFLKECGFKDNTIAFDGKIITLEEDIVISLNDVYAWMRRSAESGKVNQRKASFTLNETAAASVKVKFSTTFAADANWVAAAQEAMTYLNSLPGVAIHFTQVSSGHNITATINNSLPASRLGQADLPSSASAPGALLEVDPSNVNSLSSTAAYYGISMQDIRVHVMVHELGHTIGFRHTDSSDGSQITCTPASDPASIMNTALNLAVSFRKTFSRADWVAAQILYPDVNNLIYYPNLSYTEFGQVLNVHWYAHLINEEYVYLKVWQVVHDVEQEELELLVPNNGHHTFSVYPMIQSFDYQNVTRPDRDTELDFNCIRIEMTRPSTGEIIDLTQSFTAHYSEYL